MSMEESSIQLLPLDLAEVATTQIMLVSRVLLAIPMDVSVKLPLLQALAKLVISPPMTELSALNVLMVNTR
jgi:hypothetical protein